MFRSYTVFYEKMRIINQKRNVSIELENYDLKNVVVEALNKCSKLYGTIVLTTYGDNKDSGYIYSDQLGLYKK